MIPTEDTDERAAKTVLDPRDVSRNHRVRQQRIADAHVDTVSELFYSTSTPDEEVSVD